MRMLEEADVTDGFMYTYIVGRVEFGQRVIGKVRLTLCNARALTF